MGAARTRGREGAKGQAIPIGILFGVLAAVGQATGLVFSKQGMLGDFSPIRANVIRMLAAGVALFIVMLLQKETGKTVQTLRANPSAIRTWPSPA